MKNIPYSSYDIVFNALIEHGYTEDEAEQLICDIIEDQIEYSNFADRVHTIIKEIKDKTVS